MDVIAYLISGIAGGLLAGLFGIGGGVIVVPILAWLFSRQGFAATHLMHFAAGTSLAMMILTASATTFLHNKRQAVQWYLLKSLVPGVIVGAGLGVWIADGLSTTKLRIVFALFCFCLGLHLSWRADSTAAKPRDLPAIFLFLAAISIGLLAGLLGIGGGVLLVPLLTWLGLSLPKASATANACALPIAIAGTLAAIVFGWSNGPISGAVGYVYLPAVAMLGAGSILVGAPVGVFLAHHLPVPLVKRLFGGVLLLLSFKMILF